MADQSHLKILQQGVRAWNLWRERNPSIEPDLSGVGLRKANLSDANLSDATLDGANLSEAHLSGANLRKAFLPGANLSSAFLDGAVLSKANLSYADLSKAHLSKANLSGAFLSSANLSRADLTGAVLTGAFLNDAVLNKTLFNEANLVRALLSRADLGDANLRRSNLFEAKLGEANLSRANLNNADLTEAFLSKADLSKAWLVDAILTKADLSGADLSGTNFAGTILRYADLSRANLSHAHLTYSVLVKTDLTGATLTGCNIYGISAWNLKLEGTKQHNLNVSPYDEPAVMVDNLEVAQFIYLLLNNEKIRQVIDTITSKVVLILGRFTADRKAVLDAIRDELRQRGYQPILFDFEKPAGRDLTETISTLAHMARFIIADITQAKSIPQELQAIVPDLPSVPVQPLLLNSEHEYGMFEHFRRYPWVLDTYYYDNLDEVLASVEDKVISPAEAKVRELAR